MSRRAELALEYGAAPDRDAYLRAHSGLPGARANLELLDVAAAGSDRAEIDRWAALGPAEAPVNTPEVFLACVGVVGLGVAVARGDVSILPRLRGLANDPRWRVREAVAIGLQAWGDQDMSALTDEMKRWATGTALEGRAAMAALCEPRLLRDPSVVGRTLEVLARLTSTVRDAPDPRAADVRVLRQSLGYGWSVAVAADPEIGLPAFNAWASDPNPDVRWIVAQNRRKQRLARLLPA